MTRSDDILIVGGGLIGMLTARELAAFGAAVTVVERATAGREASWAGGGILSPLYPWRYPEPVTALAAWSQAVYPKLAETLAGESGVDPEWTRSGLLILDTEEREAALAWAGPADACLEVIDREASLALEPGLGAAEEQALWMPEVAQVRNPRLVRALRESLPGRGIALREQTEVLGIEVSGGRVAGLRTAEGSLRADRVVVAGGAWSARILAESGLELPVKPVRGQMLLFRARPGVVNRIVLSRGRYVIPRRDGRVLVGSTLEEVGFDKSTSEPAREELAREAVRLIPALADYPIEHHWSGLRPGSPSGVPYIGEHPAIRGLYVNAGHFRNGVVLGPASARLLADMLLGRPPVVPADAYRPGRATD